MDTVVHVEGCPGFCLLLLNIFFPGVGTLLSSCMGGDGIRCDQFCIGILQILLAGFLIGWIWSIYWGCLIYSKDPRKGDGYYHKP
mmetsp:Transcript_24963/g.28638  ORF Transcript_24963/g.28638 Transcript_24963/m.28638 type:complete len:85 (-) Transcript_24963:22-276(-)